jgi:hypothetical protein
LDDEDLIVYPYKTDGTFAASECVYKGKKCTALDESTGEFKYKDDTDTE